MNKQHLKLIDKLRDAIESGDDFSADIIYTRMINLGFKFVEIQEPLQDQLDSDIENLEREV